MPSRDSCCAPGCKNRRGKDGCEQVKFYRIPKDEDSRRIWLARINRADLRPAHVTDHTRLCSQHFVPGGRSPSQPYPIKFAHASYPLCRRQPAERKPAPPSRPSEAVSCSSAAVKRPAPSSGLGDQADSPKKRTCSLQPHGNFDAGSRSRDTIVRAVLDASSSSRPLPLPKSAVDPDVESSELAELRATIVSLKCEKAHLMLQNSTLQDRLKKVEEPGFEASLSTEEMWAYYTGLPSKSHFEKLLTYIEPHCHTIYSATGTPRGPRRQLSPREELLLVLMRLRLGLQEQDLQYRFKLSSVGRVSKIFTAWMPFLARILSPVLMPWPSRKKVQKNMPPAFKALKKYRKVRIILDCSEFEMEAPSSLALNAMSYSDYKGRTTVKVLFGVTPDGYVSFVSKAYGGAISDNSLTMKSGVLEKCDAGDKIMADKGFTLSNAELQPRGLATVLPPFRQGSAQFTSEEVEETKEIANLRIVVENCIMRIRYFRLLRQRLTVSSVKQASAIVKVCALLTNLRAPIR